MNVLITNEFIDSLATLGQAWTKRGFKILGLPWMPDKGWRRRILGTRIDVDDAELAAELKSIAAKRDAADAKKAPFALLLPTDSQPTTQVAGVLHFDGSANPNPGSNCQCGFKLIVGTRITERSVFLGDGTCNTAEYNGLIHGLEAAVAAGVTHLEVYGDSQLVIGGMKKGPWKKGKPHLEALKRQALDTAHKIECVDFIWIPREQNADADELSVRGLVTSARYS